MDAFYASVEQRDRPEFKGRPVIVGGQPNTRGVVAAASYEARKFGVRSAMSCRMAARLCPQAVFVPPRFSRYSEVSEVIREIFYEITPLVEPLSLDEAYLDVTENSLHEPIARNIAVHIKRKIREVTGLTASAGVAPNKFLAKVASDLKKPDGLVVIPPEKVLGFVETLPVERLWGVGPKMTQRLHALGLFRTGDLRGRSLEFLRDELGEVGIFLWELAHGRDDRPVSPDFEPKSRGVEETFERDVLDLEFLRRCLQAQSVELADSLAEIDVLAKTVVIKLRYADFTTITRSRTLAQPSREAELLCGTAWELLETRTHAGETPVRLIGLSARIADPLSAVDAVQLKFPFWV